MIFVFRPCLDLDRVRNHGEFRTDRQKNHAHGSSLIIYDRGTDAIKHCLINWWHTTYRTLHRVRVIIIIVVKSYARRCRIPFRRVSRR